MGDLTLFESQSQSPAAPLTTQSRPLPFREDCWSEDATSTLVEAWGRRYMELNRGNLRQKDWQEVADAVNARHGHNKKARRTDVQCKNRIDTLKKKYKVEKARVTESNGTLTSSWPFFSRLDSLIGSAVASGKKQLQQQQQSPLMNMNTPSPPMAVPLPYRKPVGSTVTMMMPQKRPLPLVDDSYFRRNYSAVAAAAAAAEEEGMEEEEDNQSEDLASSEETGGGGGCTGGGERKGREEMEGMRRLARAIERFGEIYEKVEGEKQKQMIDLEKQRMQFAKDLEVQRMQLFMDTQVQLEKIKQAKRSGSDDIYSLP